MRPAPVAPLPLRRIPLLDPRLDLIWLLALAALPAIACDSVSPVENGAIEVTSSTTGGPLDPDGYTVSLDAATGQAIGVNASLTLSAVAPGEHTVELSGLASNCTVTEQNPGTVTVVANGTAQVGFTVNCSSGSLEIVTETTGSALDPDGYTVSVDAGAAEPIGINASLTLSDVATGQRTVELSGLAANCSVNEANPTTVTVVANGTAQIGFTVTCNSGSIKITTLTTGTILDPDGYTVSLDGAPEQPIDINASLTLSDVPSGRHTIELSGLASNCGVSGNNPRTVTVMANSTAQVGFAVSCNAGSRIRVTVSTTGTNIPGLFIVTFQTPELYFLEISPNGSVTSKALSLGSHTVNLGISPNCTVTGSSPQPVTVQEGVIAQVTFAVECS